MPSWVELSAVWWFWLSFGILLGLSGALWLIELFPEKQKPALEIIFDEYDEAGRYWSKAYQTAGQRHIIEGMQYRIAVHNNTGKTIKNVRVWTELPNSNKKWANCLFVRNDAESYDINPQAAELVRVLFLEKDAALFGKMILRVSATDTSEIHRSFDVDSQRRPAMVFSDAPKDPLKRPLLSRWLQRRRGKRSRRTSRA